jgi:hypothetical protein
MSKSDETITRILRVAIGVLDYATTTSASTVVMCPYE